MLYFDNNMSDCFQNSVSNEFFIFGRTEGFQSVPKSIELKYPVLLSTDVLTL